MSEVDFSPRRVWFGLYIPGKKTFRIDAGPKAWMGLDRARMLIDCYKGNPSRALVYASLCLHLLPESGAEFGPAMRDIRKPLRSGRLYGAILTDIRDFLKFRYRAHGMREVSSGAIARLLVTGLVPEGVQPDRPAMAINYAISALDALSKDPELVEEGKPFVDAVYSLRDLLEGTARFLHRLEVGEEAWEKWVAGGWDYQFPWKFTAEGTTPADEARS